MKNRFPADLMVVVFGPLLVMIGPLMVGSLVFHSAASGAAWRGVAAIAVGSLAFAFLLLWLRRRRRQR